MGSNSIDPAYMEALLSTVTPETFAIIAVVNGLGSNIKGKFTSINTSLK